MKTFSEHELANIGNVSLIHTAYEAGQLRGSPTANGPRFATGDIVAWAKGGCQTEPDPIAAFDKAVRERMARGMERLAACAAVARANPELHRRYLAATNQSVPVAQRQV